MEENKKMSIFLLIPMVIIAWPVYIATKLLKLAYILIVSIIGGIIVTIQQLFLFRR